MKRLLVVTLVLFLMLGGRVEFEIKDKQPVQIAKTVSLVSDLTFFYVTTDTTKANRFDRISEAIAAAKNEDIIIVDKDKLEPFEIPADKILIFKFLNYSHGKKDTE